MSVTEYRVWLKRLDVHDWSVVKKNTCPIVVTLVSQGGLLLHALAIQQQGGNMTFNLNAGKN